MMGDGTEAETVMTVRYRMSFADLLWLQSYTYRRSPVVLAVNLLFALFVIYRVYTSVPQPKSPLIHWAATLVVSAVFLVVWLVVMSLCVAVAMVSRANRTLLTEHVVTLTDTGLIEETNLHRTEQKWAGITRLARTRRHIFAYVSQYAAHVIPRRAFSDPGAWDQFYAQLQARVQRVA
jgi:hypothetical protein